MARLVPKLLFIGNTQAGSIYNTPTDEGSYSIVKSINVCNTSSASQSFSINLVQGGGSVGTNNAILGNIVMSGGNVFSYETSIVLPAGSSLHISQPGTDLTFTISGVENVI